MAVTLQGCQIACEMAQPACTSFSYNPTVQQCFPKQGGERPTCTSQYTPCYEANQNLQVWAEFPACFATTLTHERLMSASRGNCGKGGRPRMFMVRLLDPAAGADLLMWHLADLLPTGQLPGSRGAQQCGGQWARERSSCSRDIRGHEHIAGWRCRTVMLDDSRLCK